MAGPSPYRTHQSKQLGANAAAGASLGSGFGPYGSAIGAGAGVLFGSLFNDTQQPTGINYNMHRELNQRRRLQEQEYGFQKGRIKAQVEGAREAGLHPLAALGLSPGGQPVQGGAVPQKTGSAVGDAIRTGMDHYANRQIAQLQVKNMELQNDYIREQIRASQTARAAQTANTQQDRIKVLKTGDNSVYRKLGSSLHPGAYNITVEKPPLHTGQSDGLNLFGFDLLLAPFHATMQAIEDYMGEPVAWALSPFIAAHHIGYNIDTRLLNPAIRKYWSKLKREGYLKRNNQQSIKSQDKFGPSP